MLNNRIRNKCQHYKQRHNIIKLQSRYTVAVQSSETGLSTKLICSQRFNLHEMDWRREEKVATRFNFISIRFSLRVGHRMTLDPRKAYLNIERSRTCSRNRLRNRGYLGQLGHDSLLFELFLVVVALLMVAYRSTKQTITQKVRFQISRIAYI